MNAMKRQRKLLIFTIVLVDTILFAICLLSFCYFHHVRRMWAAEPEAGEGGIIAGRPDIGGGADASARHPEETSPAPDTAAPSRDGDAAGQPTETEPETEPPETEPPEPKHKFEELFAAEGEVEVTDTYYKSHDIYMTVTEVTGPVSDYVARYYVLDVYVRYIENIFTTYSTTDARYPFIDLVTSAGSPIAAVSGDYWRLNADIAVRNGVTLSEKRRTEGDFCVMYRDGTITMHDRKELPGFEITDDVYQVWDFGPSLLDSEGKARTSFGSWFNNITGRNPRSSIGYFEPYHYCFIVADRRKTIKYNGKSTYIKGIRFTDLAKIYEDLGCVSAYCFDGGNSAYAYYNGEIIRHQEPSDDMRKIYDIICVGEIR